MVLRESFPFVESLISESPKLKNWQFNAFRQRIIGNELGIKYGNFEINYNDLYFKYSINDDELGIELNIKNYDRSEEMKNAIYVLLDGLLGEYDTTMNISWIEWKKLDENNIDNLTKFIHLRDIVDSRKK